MVRIIDLSVPLQGWALEPSPPEIVRWDHREGARRLASRLGVSPQDFPGGQALAVEEVRAITHAGTHLDAPWHYGPSCEGRPARTVDQVPLEWCYGPGVVLDVRHRGPGEEITREDLEAALRRIGHRLRPRELVLLHTGASRFFGQPDYPERHPGLGPEGLEFLLDHGVKVVGTDAYSLDRPFSRMAEECRRGHPEALFPAHFLGRRREYCQVEKLANLELLPPHGFTVAVFPVKVEGAGAAWCRAVAILEE